MSRVEDNLDAAFARACAVADLKAPPKRRESLRAQWQELENLLDILRRNEIPAAMVDGFTGGKK